MKDRVRFQVLTATNMQMTDVALCNLTGVDQHFRGAYCFHHQVATMLMEVAAISET
jgi:hypothetical protein